MMSESHIYVKVPGPRTQARPALEIKQKIRKKILDFGMAKILDLLSMIYIKFQIQQKAKKIQGESNSITNLHVSRPSRAESARPAFSENLYPYPFSLNSDRDAFKKIFQK